MVKKLYISVIAVLLTACDATIHEYPQTINDEIEVRVILNTDGVSNVTCDIYNETLPRPTMDTEMMRVLFYDPESGCMSSQCFISQKTVTPEGYEVVYGRTHLSPGDYIMLAYNFDTETVQVENENSLSEINAYTPEIPDYLYSLLQDSGEGEVFQSPEHLLVARKEVRVEASPQMQVIEAEARTVVDTYYLQIRVRGLQYASTAKATLSGMSSSNRFGIGERDSDPSRTMFDLSGGIDTNIADENKDVLCTLFNTFGKVEGVTSNLTVRFDVITSDGTQYVKTLDISPTFLTEDARERHWLLIDYVLEIPEPHHEGGGFDPGVDDWDEIHDYIKI